MANESTFILVEMDVDLVSIKRLVRSYLNKPAAEDALNLARDISINTEQYFEILTVELVD